MNRKPVVNIGVQRFDKLRKQGSFYIDKTDFIREWWETGSEVTLITRPRRFGKTLNMSMLECFFSRKYEGQADLFNGLSIFGYDSDRETYRNLQGRFPVIFLTFANIKADRYPEMESKIAEVIAGLYNENDYLLDGDCLNANEKEYYKNIKIGMSGDIAVGAVHQMACFMQRYYRENVIILLDKYDTPMQEAWLSGYWDKAISFA